MLYAQQYAAYQQYLHQQQQYYQQYPEAYQQQQQHYAAYYNQYGVPQQSYAHALPQQPQDHQPPHGQQSYVANPNFTLVPSPTSAFSPPTKTTATNPIYTEQQAAYPPQQPQPPQ
uniref:RNA polymerase II degradation factor 1 n=1 Tax=Steinernema glaseri TaxID=37863 RepID=A0A1I7ZCY0_9BILA